MKNIKKIKIKDNQILGKGRQVISTTSPFPMKH